MRTHTRGFLITAAVLALAACSDTPKPVDKPGATAPVELGEDGVVFYRGNGAEPDTLDPHRSEETGAAEVLRDLFEGLTSESVTSETVPGVAERWDISDDGKTYTFYLRENARWSNGDPVVAEDFVVGLRRSVSPETASAYSQMLWPIENAEPITRNEMEPNALGVEAAGEKTLIVRLRAPTPYFLNMLNHSATYPIHRASLEEFGEQFARPGNLVSNGAYKLAEWVPQSRIKVVRNENYWDNANVQIDTVIFYPTEDISAELKRYRAGELDFTDQIPNNQFKWIKENLGDEIEIAPYLSTYFYAFNNRRPPFTDKRLRQALVMAFDRKALTEFVTGVGELPAFGFVPPGINNYEPASYPWTDWPDEKRLAEARRLYAEAGYGPGNPLRTEIRYNTSENHKKIAVAVAGMWKDALGVEATLLNEEWKVFLQNRKNLDLWEVIRYGWVGDYNDAFTFLEILHSTHGQNDSGFNDPEYDRLVEAASVESDLDKRREMLRQAEEVMLNDYPVMPMYFYVNKHIVKPYVKGFKPNIMDHNYSKHYQIDVGARGF